MPAPVSIIIPTLNAGKDLPDTIRSLMEGLEAGLVRELIISDGGSTDETRRIAEEVGAVLIEGVAGRGVQLIRGARAGQAEWLLFLHADTHLAAGWAHAVQAHIVSETRAGWFRLAFRARGLRPKIVALWANLRAKAGLPFGDQALLISRSLYDEVGGYPPLPLMEDMAMARQLKGRLTGLPATALTDASAYLEQGWFRRGGANLWRQIRFLLGAEPADMARGYSVSEN